MAQMSLATSGGLYAPPCPMLIKVAASISGEHRHTKSHGARNLHCLAASACRPLRHPPRPHSDMVEDRGVSHSMIVLINGSSATLFDQVNAWDDFHQVEHRALVVPAGGAKFLAGLLFV